MTELPIIGIAVAAFVALITMLVRKSRSLGQAETRGAAVAETQKKVDEVVVAQANEQVKQVEKANEARDRLDADPAYRASVRERFTRD